MSDKCVGCGHLRSDHDGRGCRYCGCPVFMVDAMAAPTASLERIAVALESIAKSLDAMRRDAK